MIFDKLIAKQVRHPRGIFNGFVARQMNRGNTNINTITVQLLQIQPSNRVLEIGFGGGYALDKMAMLIQDGLLAGVEVSDAMLKRGRKRFNNFISQGKMELKKGSSEKIPYEDCFFDKVCAVNCIYFWPNPITDLKEIRRVMKNGGKLIISIITEEMAQKISCTRYGFTLYSDSQLQGLLNEAGFKDIHLEYREWPSFEAMFAIATKR